MTIGNLIGQLKRYPLDMLVFVNHDGKLEIPEVQLCSALKDERGDFAELLMDDDRQVIVVSIGVAF